MQSPRDELFNMETEPLDKAAPLRTWLKREKLAESDFNYFRGTAEQFYAYWAKLDLPKSPLVWSCGDVHVKNVGTYRADNEIAYFDMNDFDEACQGPVYFDLGRAATGLFLTHGAGLTEEFLAVYAETLAAGKPFHTETESAVGPAKILLDRVETRTRKDFLAQWVKSEKIREVEGETYRLSVVAKKRAKAIFEEWANKLPDKKYFRVVDICGSTAGIGSLSAERYLVLIQGKKKPHIIDMKQATPSAHLKAHKTPQPTWRNDAQRAAEVQRFMQYMPIAHLGWTDSKPVSFVLTEFQPAEDRMESLDLSQKVYSKFVRQWAALVAWGHLRAAGWKGSPPSDTLIEFGQKFSRSKQNRVLQAAQGAAKLIKDAHLRYAAKVLPDTEFSGSSR